MKMMCNKNWQLGCLVAAGLVGALGTRSAHAQTTAGAPVTLVQNGGIVVLDNGIVRAEVDTASARVVSLRYGAHEMVQTQGNRKNIYFSMAGGQSYEQPAHCVFSVTQQNADGVDISCKRVYSPGDKQPWDLDIHYALRRGVSGLYSYALVSHPAAYPDAGMGEWRTVWWMPTENGKSVLDRIYVDETRHWNTPSLDDLAKAEPTGIKEIVKLTTGPWAGRYDCKYAYSAEYENVGTYGHASDANGLGAWMVLGGTDYFNDGPGKQDLAPASGIIHLHLYRNHYGAPGFTIKHGQAWQKVYGPWLMYLNSAPSADAAWADARAQVGKEAAQWPYRWVGSPEYAPTTRGKVEGHFVVRDALKPTVSGANAWVGLARAETPGDPMTNWQFQGDAYQYWTRANAQGAFSIPAVRPGSYTLYAFTDGAVGEFSRQNVSVSANGTTRMGDVQWQVPHVGKHIAWEIGVPDRSTHEFRHGATDYYTPYIWDNFNKEFSNPLEYDVRHDTAAKLNYAQSGYGTGATRQQWKWRIHFPLDRVPTGDSTLTLAFAGANGANVEVYMNDETKPLSVVVPVAKGGNALLRESNHAKYGVSTVSIPAARLRAGENTLTLVATPLKWDGDHVMYDYMSLETP